MRPSSFVCALAVVLASGCLFQNIGAAERLNDAVWGLNDDARWGMVPAAAERVQPRYKRRFMLSRRGWGRAVQIADTEISRVDLADDEKKAVSWLAVRWYTEDTMELRETFLRQSWLRDGRDFVLVSERVVAGDPHLLVR